MIPNIGPMELIIVLVIAVLVLGPKRLPDAARSVGKGIRGFKETVNGIGDSDEDEKKPEVSGTSGTTSGTTTH